MSWTKAKHEAARKLCPAHTPDCSLNQGICYCQNPKPKELVYLSGALDEIERLQFVEAAAMMFLDDETCHSENHGSGSCGIGTFKCSSCKAREVLSKVLFPRAPGGEG